MPPSAISGTPVSRAAVGAVQHRGQLRHADAGDEPGRAREAGPDADLDGVGAGRGEVAHAVGGGDVAGDHLGLAGSAA